MTGLGGAITALITPFRGGKLDAPALAQLTTRQVAAGTTALVVCGSTGEASCLSVAEHAAAVGVVVREVAGRVKVIAGCSAASTEEAATRAMAAAAQGADALLLAAPAYVKPTQDGIAAHVRAVAHAADLPIMLYDIPGRTGVSIHDATIARLFAARLIFALKDATADLARPVRLGRVCGPEWLQFTGDDATAPAYCAMGGDGCVSVTGNIVPALCAALHRAWDDDELAGFGRLRDLLDPLHQALFVESNPIPVKAALAGLGLCEDELRLPLTRAGAICRSGLEELLPALMSEEARCISQPRLAWAS